MERLHKAMDWVCAVENVLYACYDSRGLMWFDTKVKVWRSVVMSLYALEACRYAKHAVAEYEGKLAIFQLIKHGRVENTKSVKMSLFSFHRVGERILGKIEWSGIVATDPSLSRFSHCLGMII
ncbi:Galactose oxidase/kelch repeat superfamily protein [Raphanus sativus]|nr:Galactose oxidase/kelch repeat superfamily protein [Raphanus sativus]